MLSMKYTDPDAGCIFTLCSTTNLIDINMSKKCVVYTCLDSELDVLKRCLPGLGLYLSICLVLYLVTPGTL